MSLSFLEFLQIPQVFDEFGRPLGGGQKRAGTLSRLQNAQKGVSRRMNRTAEPMPSRMRSDSALVTDLVTVLLSHPAGLRRWSVMRAMRMRAEKANREVTPKFEDDVERVFRRHCTGDSVRAGLATPLDELFHRPKESVGEVWAANTAASRAYLSARGFDTGR